eukprot:scaffold68724_cov30-Tisochrysis_lutea.AAC.1
MQILDARCGAAEVGYDALRARKDVYDAWGLCVRFHGELQRMCGAKSTLKSAPTLCHVRRIVGDFAMYCLVDCAVMTPFDPMPFKRLDRDGINGFARVPICAKWRRRDQPLLNFPAAVDAVNGDPHERAALV